MDLDDECQVFQEFSVVKYCFLLFKYFWILIYEMIHIFSLVTYQRKFQVFIKAILVGHVINEGRKIYNKRHACLTKENNSSL